MRPDRSRIASVEPCGRRKRRPECSVLLPLRPSGYAPAEPSALTLNINIPDGGPEQTAEVGQAKLPNSLGAKSYLSAGIAFTRLIIWLSVPLSIALSDTDGSMIDPGGVVELGFCAFMQTVAQIMATYNRNRFIVGSLSFSRYSVFTTSMRDSLLRSAEGLSCRSG